jgi:hypothetical protein
MSITKQLAKHLRDVHFGGNWTVSSMKEHLSDVSWEEATRKIHSFNPIATLTFHVNYYVEVFLKKERGETLNAKDEYSFLVPPIHSQEDWENLLKKVWEDAEAAAKLIEEMPDEKLAEIFIAEKYGTYYRNIAGIIEHTHYHLGQMVLIKKLIREEEKK